MTDRTDEEWAQELQWARENGHTEYEQNILTQVYGGEDPSPPAMPEPAPAPVPEPDTLGQDTLQGVGEFANAGNRSFLEGLDYIGPGAVNAAARLSNQHLGTDFGQMPTLTGTFEENVPGAYGGFMEEGTARDVVRGVGGALPVAGSMVSVPRNLASLPGAAAEIAGFGSAAPAAQAGQTVAGMLDDPSMVSRADNIGWPLTPGDRMGSDPLKRLEAGIESTPMPFNPMERVRTARQGAINAAAAESIGIPGKTRLTDQTMGGVADDLSAEFDRLGLEEDLLVGRQFHDEMAEIEEVAGSRIFKDNKISEVVDSIMDRVGESGRLGAVDYQDISSELKMKIREAWRGNSPDPQFADSLSGMVRALDDLAEDQLDGAALARLREARRKWKNFQSLEKSRAVKESGDVSGPLLANHLRRTDKGGYSRGKNTGQLHETARMSKAFPSAPDSGTASRMFYQNLFNQHPFAVMGGAGGLGGMAMAADPIHLAMAAAGLALPPAAANAYMKSPQIAGALRQVPLRPGVATSALGYLEENE